jgi:glycosyltransferase involved in cell wall biosynthesis
MPCYRCADTVARALESVLGQSRAVAEVILVDDASGDGTLDVLQALQARNAEAQVRVLSMDRNLGPGGARNAGWEAATQPWIAFLDADDSWHPRKIELQYGWLEVRSGVDLCAHGTALWARAKDDAVSGVGLPVRIEPRRLLVRNVVLTRTVMLRRDLPLRFGGKDVSEDYLLWLELAWSGHSLWKLPAVLAYAHRPEYSPGGYSGGLWTHEKRELRCFRRLYDRGMLGILPFLGASAFSLLKFVRRAAIVRRGDSG